MSSVTLTVRLSPATTRDFPVQRLPCGDPDCRYCYPIHAERRQVERFGLRRFQQLASEADAAIEALPCGTR